MKRCLLLLSVLAWAVWPLNAGKVVTESLSSSVLGTVVKYNVYLPDGFDSAGGKTYPVVYLLHGLSDDYTAWMKLGNMKPVADELIRCGEAVPMVIIMPNAGGPDIHNTWNGYFNMPQWRYEDFFFTELMPECERKFHCGGAKQRRAVMGLSMGGGGSAVYCQRHPDLFSSCYAMSAWLDNRNGEVHRNATAVDKLYYVREAVNAHSALDFMDRADAATLQRLRTVAWFLDCGDDDFLLKMNVEFYMKMRSAKVPCELRVRNGIHNWEYWHYALRLALPFASRNFS